MRNDFCLKMQRYAVWRARAGFLLIIFSLSVLALCHSTATAAAITLEHIQEVKAGVEKLRGLKFIDEVNIEFVDEARLAEVARGIMEANGMGADELAKAELILRAFGMLADGEDLEQAVEDMLSGEIAGLYDPEADTMYVLKDYELPGGAPTALRALSGVDPLDVVLYHELGHALQDQHFHLERLAAMREASEDGALAFLSVAEGDATLLMINMMLAPVGTDVFHSTAADRLLDTFAFQGATGDGTFDALPFVVKNQLIFPYAQGSSFLLDLYKTGGRALMDQALLAPPRSSEQILHPEKYVSGGDPPLEITFPDAGDYVPFGWELLDSTTLGEFHARLLLRILLGPENEKYAYESAEGWGGDRFAAFDDGRGRTALLWLSVWDDETHARAFFEAYTRGLTGIEETWRVGWETECGQNVLERRGVRVAMLHCVPNDKVVPFERMLFDAEAVPQ